MKNEIKSYGNCANQDYVSPSAEVIELSSQRGICVLAGSVTNNPFEGEEEDW